MQRIIKPMEATYLQPSLELVEDVFTKWDSAEEGKTVRKLVEEIRSRKYYLPDLELIMTDEPDRILGYAMFSRFHIESRYENADGSTFHLWNLWRRGSLYQCSLFIVNTL